MSKPNRHPPHDGGNGEQKRSVTGEVHVRGEITVESGQDEKRAQEASDRKTEKKDKQNRWINLFTLLVTIFYAGFTLVLMLQSIESNRLSREALQSVQRAFITFRTISSNRVLKTGSNPRFDFKVSWENSGNTPATGVIQFFAFKELNHEPSEEEFIDFKELPPEAHVTFLGPKATMDSTLITMNESFSNQFLGLSSDTKTASGYAGWGFVAYRDVFKGTAIRLTEFCEQLDHVSSPDNHSIDPTFIFNPCKQHNCIDEFCSDYQSVVKLVKEKLPAGS